MVKVDEIRMLGVPFPFIPNRKIAAQTLYKNQTEPLILLI